MAEDEAALELLIKKAEIDFKKGRGLTTEQLRKVVSSWK